MYTDNITQDSSKIKFSIDSVKQKLNEKPKRGSTYFVDLHERWVATELTVTEYSDLSSSGVSHSPAVFKNNVRVSDNFIQTDFIELDCDSGYQFDEIKEHLKTLDLDITFAHETLSSTPEQPKYRIFIRLSNSIVDLSEYKEILTYLIESPSKPYFDKACKDGARFFLGGKNAFYTNFDYMANTEELRIRALGYAVGTDKKNQSRNLSKYTKKVSVSINEDREVIAADLNELSGKIKILNEFLAVNRRYSYNELFGISTNLYVFKGGKTLFEERLKELKDFYCDFDDRYSTLTYALWRYNYNPKSLSDFSPFKEDHIYNNFKAVHFSNSLKIKPIELMPIELAEAQLHLALTEAINSDDNKVYVIKAATGLGKSKAIKELPLNNTLIAVPTHDLKNEFSSGFSSEVTTIPEMPIDYIQEHHKELFKRLSYLQLIGNFNGVMYLLSENRHIEVIDSFLKNYDKACKATGNVLTTTSKALQNQDRFSQQTYMIDEDCLSYLNVSGTVLLSDVLKIDESIDNFDEFFSLRKKCHVILDFKPRLNKSIQEALSGHIFQSNISGFLQSEFFSINEKGVITFGRFLSLPKNKKIIVLSATADKWIYEKLVGERLVFTDISNVELKGKIKQTLKSASRTSLMKKDGINQDYLDLFNGLNLNHLPCITFKAAAEQIGNTSDGVYFGNCSGTNKLEGQDIVVLGTPHTNTIQYRVLAKMLQVDVADEDFSCWDTHLIETESHTFRFRTSANPQIQRIHCWVVSSELEQAIGRARLLRRNCTVYLISNYPVKQSVFC